jgi:hypothetical protein
MTKAPDPKVVPLDYATPPPRQSADPRRMFLYLLPGGIFMGALVGSVMIEHTFPYDSRNFGGGMCILVMAPFALIYGVVFSVAHHQT